MPLVLFTLVSFRSHAKPNWLAPAYWSLIILGVRHLLAGGAPRWRVGLASSAAIALLALGVLAGPAAAAAARRGQLERLARGGATRGRRSSALLESEGQRSFVFSPNYKISSLMRFYLPGQPRTYAQDIYGARALQFDHGPAPQDLRGATGLLVLSDQSQSSLDLARLKPWFDSVTLAAVVETQRLWRPGAPHRDLSRHRLHRPSAADRPARRRRRRRPSRPIECLRLPRHSFLRVTMPQLSIVVPTFNESGNVRQLVRLVHDALAGIDWELIFVDDDSPDGTADSLRELAQLDPRVRCILRLGRRGLSSACIEGMLASSAPLVAVMDADLQHDERLLRGMLETMRDPDIDVVVGSRYAGDGSVGEWSERRASLSRMATRMSRALLKAELHGPDERLLHDPARGAARLPARGCLGRGLQDPARPVRHVAAAAALS